ncbi:5427_t:CDS:2, partial [Entrophospora sp. SA101]
ISDKTPVTAVDLDKTQKEGLGNVLEHGSGICQRPKLAQQKVIIENAVVAATIDNGAASSVVSKLLLDELGYEIEQTTNNTLIKAVGSLPRPLGKINYFSICIGAFYTPISFDTTDVNNINYCWVEEEEYCGPTTENDEEGGEKIEEGSVRVNLNVGPLTTPQKEKFYKLVEECQDIFARDES